MKSAPVEGTVRPLICGRCGSEWPWTVKRGKVPRNCSPCTKALRAEKQRAAPSLPTDEVTRVCKRCGIEKPMEAFSEARQCRGGRRYECKTCRSVREKANWKHNGHRPSRTREYKRNSQFQFKYGITLREYEDMLEAQGHRCAVCGGTDVGWNREGNMVVDHCHDSGRIRGLLCHWCNSLLGQAKDDPEILRKAILYLAAHLEVVQQEEIDKSAADQQDATGSNPSL